MSTKATRLVLGETDTNAGSSSLIVKQSSTRKRKLNQAELALAEPEDEPASTFFFPSRSFMPKAEESDELLPEAYTDLFEELEDLPCDYANQLVDLKAKHQQVVEVFSELAAEQHIKGSKTQILTTKKMDSLLQQKILYDTILAISSLLSDPPSEQTASQIRESDVVQEITSLIYKVNPASVSATIKGKKKKKKNHDPGDAEETGRSPRKKRKCNENKKAANGTGDEAESDQAEPEPDEGGTSSDKSTAFEKSAIKKRKQEKLVFDHIRSHPLKVLQLSPAQIENVETQAAAEGLDHLALRWEELDGIEQSILSLLWPLKEDLELHINDRTKEDPAPYIVIQLHLQSMALQLSISSCAVFFTETAFQELTKMIQACTNRKRSSIEAATIQQALSSSCTPMSYAYACHHQNAAAGSKQLIGTVGILDPIVDAKGGIVKNIVPWLHAELAAYYGKDIFVVHPLVTMKDIKEAAKMTLQELSLKVNEKMVLRIRKALVELCSNGNKAMTLLAGFGLGVTASAIWHTLCRPGMSTLRSATSDWHLSSIIDLILEFKVGSHITLPPEFFRLASTSPVTAMALQKWQTRLKTCVEARDIKNRGTLAYTVRAIVNMDSSSADPPSYKIAMSSPNLVIAAKEVPVNSKLLTEWTSLSIAQQKKLKEFDTGMMDKQEEDED